MKMPKWPVRDPENELVFEARTARGKVVLQVRSWLGMALFLSAMFLGFLAGIMVRR